MTKRTLPPSASYVEPGEDDRLFAPSAARNGEAIGDVLSGLDLRPGNALELASGTGQHVVGFARRFPALTWQPSDPDPARRASIAAYRAAEGPDNLLPPIALNACAPGWSDQHRDQSLILVVNLLHLISTPEAQTLIDEAARALSPGGTFVVYGPFMRDGTLTSAGDKSFHAALQASADEIGYKNDADVATWMQNAGLNSPTATDMPSNNLVLATRKP